MKGLKYTFLGTIFPASYSAPQIPLSRRRLEMNPEPVFFDGVRGKTRFLELSRNYVWKFNIQHSTYANDNYEIFNSFTSFQESIPQRNGFLTRNLFCGIDVWGP